MNYNEYFGKGNQNAGYGTSGRPETTPENWDDYFDGQSIHVPIQKIYADSPQVSSPTIPNKGRSYMDVTPVVTERPSHELMLQELQQREAAHRMAQQQKDYYRTWDQKVRQMDEESRSDMTAQAAPGSSETGRLSDYFDIEPGDYAYDSQPASGRPARPRGKAKKVVFTEDGPVFADEHQQKLDVDEHQSEPAVDEHQQKLVINASDEEAAGLKAILKKPVLPIKEKNVLHNNITENIKEGEVKIIRDTKDNTQDAVTTALDATDSAQTMQPDLDALNAGPDSGIIIGDPLSLDDLPVSAPAESRIPDSPVLDTLSTGEITVPRELLEDDPNLFDTETDLPAVVEEPGMEFVAGETEVDGIEEDVEEDIEEETADEESIDDADAGEEIEEPSEETGTAGVMDELLGGIDISDLPEDIPDELLDTEYTKQLEERSAAGGKKKPGRKKSDKTVKTRKKASESKTTAKKPAATTKKPTTKKSAVKKIAGKK